ncbi:hypothetical protein MAR_021889, partial [Mya arenaria]
KPDNAVINVPTLKEGDPANITCTSTGGRPSSTLSLMVNATNMSSIAITTTDYKEDSRTYTIQIVLNASAKREWHSMNVSCFQLTHFFTAHMTEKETINCRYPPSELFLEKPDIPSKLQDIYHRVNDFNDNCSLQWTSDKPSLLKYRNPEMKTNVKSIMSILNVSVTKEDFGKEVNQKER